MRQLDCENVIIGLVNQGIPKPYWQVSIVLDVDTNDKSIQGFLEMGIPLAYRFEYEVGMLVEKEKAYKEAEDCAKSIQRLIDLVREDAVQKYCSQRT